jgi:hypothetical protein
MEVNFEIAVVHKAEQQDERFGQNCPKYLRYEFVEMAERTKNRQLLEKIVVNEAIH